MAANRNPFRQPFINGAYPSRTPMAQGYPAPQYASPQPYTSPQPHTSLQPYASPQPHTSPQPYTSLQPYASPQPYQPYLHPSPPSPSSSHRAISAPPQGGVHNNNNASGTFNNINGDQYNEDNSTTNNERYEGDTFSGTINGGNVGGRKNDNAIHNGGSSSFAPRPSRTPTPTPPAAEPTEQPVRQPGESFDAYRMRVDLFITKQEIDSTEQEISNLMDILGYDKKRRLEVKLAAARQMKNDLTAELNSHEQPSTR